MLVLVGTHFVPTGTYFCIFIEHKIEWIFKINELKIERWKKLNFALVLCLYGDNLLTNLWVS